MNIFITGVSKGLGLEMLKLFLTQGHAVYCVSRSLSEELSNLKIEYPDRVFYKIYDLTDIHNIKQELFKDFLSLKVPIHSFINNAAIAYDDIITNIDYHRLIEMFNVNVFAPMMITKYIIRNMLFNKLGGSIIHISSISVHTGYKGLSMYAASKGALEAFSKNSAREWGERKIRSNTIVAGFMETSMSSSLTDLQIARIINRTSLKQLTEVSSVAELAVFLASEVSSSITGQNIHIDSGTI